MKAIQCIIALMSFAVFISCGGAEAEATASRFEIAEPSYNVSSEGGRVEISMLSTGAWAASCDKDWVEVLTSSGIGSEKSQIISVKVDANEESMSREASVVVSAGANLSEVTIHQSGKEAAVEPEPDPDYSVVSAVSKDGEYLVKGTVVAAGSTAYIIADETGALMVYDTDHDRRVMESVSVKGTASRYNGRETNVYQLIPSETKLLSTTSVWTYSPRELDAAAMGALLGKTASCEEVQLCGILKIDGKYINVLVEGISNKVSIYYVESEDYAHLDGRSVTVKGYVTGTYNYLYLLPYSVTENQPADPDPEPEPDPEPAPEGNNDPRGKKWMELPSMKDASLGYYYHDFEMNSRTYRNYSFGWDDTNKVAFWIAYPLCSMYSNKKVNRSDAWALDPLLGDASPYPGPGYAGDYDRGHQVPSGDRLCCYDANAQTFYGTNMTAQSNSLNGGSWENLETNIRNFAVGSDTTYVVTGCYVKDSYEWTTDTNGMRLKVPTAYFKAVLVLKNGNWTGGAYWTPHFGFSSSYVSWAISIDALEQKTGLDLFVNLPSKIGQSAADTIEAAKPGNSRWWN